MPSDFAPRDMLDRLLRLWWLLAAMVIAGGIAGWIVFLLRPPLYEARAAIHATIDQTRTGPLTQFEEDTALNMIGAVITSRSVIDAAIARIQTGGLPLEPSALLSNNRIERYGERWELRIRHPEAQAAATAANLWIDEAHARLVEASHHAQQADHLRTYLLSLETCIQRSLVETDPPAACSLQSAAQVQEEIASVGAALAEEIDASLGIWPAVTIGLLEPAQVPVRPAVRGLNSLVLAGSLIGFLLGLWVIGADLPRQIRVGRRYA